MTGAAFQAPEKPAADRCRIDQRTNSPLPGGAGEIPAVSITLGAQSTVGHSVWLCHDRRYTTVGDGTPACRRRQADEKA